MLSALAGGDRFKMLESAAPSRGVPFRLIAGMVFAVLNLTIVTVAVWAADSIPATLEHWRTSLLPPEEEYRYRIAFGRAIVQDSELELTIAIQAVAGRPIVVDAERMALSPIGRSHDWTATARLVDSSKGRVPVIVISEGTPAWIRIKAQMPDGARKEAADQRWSSKLLLGNDSVDLNEVPIELVGNAPAPAPP